MTRYLRRVKQVWSYIVGGGEGHYLQTDAYTVHLLQGRCPSMSLEDRTYVETQMLKGEILPAIKSWEQRSAILERIYSVEYSIPSIHTFLEGTKVLEFGARILKEIIPFNCKYSIAQAFESLHNGQTGLKLQLQEFSFEHSIQPSVARAQWIAYRQLWSLCLRHFPWMIGQAPRKDARRPKPQRPKIQPRWWYELASLASENGFQRIRQHYPNLQNVDAEIVEDFLRETRPPEFYRIEPMDLHDNIQAICAILQGIRQSPTTTKIPELTSDYDDCGWDIINRCGIPFEKAFLADRQYLFLNIIYSNSYSIIPKRYLTSFNIKRDFFHSFFGTLEEGPSLNNEDIPGNVEPSDAATTSPQLLQLPDASAPPPSNNTTNEDTSGDIAMPDLPISPLQDLMGHEDASEVLRTPGIAQTLPQDQIVSFAEASRVLGGGDSPGFTFTAYSPTKNGTFHARHADSRNVSSMLGALRRPYELIESQPEVHNSKYLVHDPEYLLIGNGKRLKLTTLKSIIEEARTKNLKAVLKVPPTAKVQSLIRQFESRQSREESEEL